MNPENDHPTCPYCDASMDWTGTTPVQSEGAFWYDYEYGCSNCGHRDTYSSDSQPVEQQ